MSQPVLPRLGSASRYERVWATVVLVAALAWMSVAVLQTPRLPLLAIAAGVGAVGGTLFVRTPAGTAAGRRQYAAGALGVAGLALVTVGIGHHLALGLATVALLAGSSPWVIRWIAGRA